MRLLHLHIYKPRRILYYINPSDEELDGYYKGNVPEVLSEYGSAFGTYDFPGLYRIKKDNKVLEVIGVEFRPDDERINYPKGLEHIELEGSFYISALLADVDYVEAPMVDECVYQVINELPPSRGFISAQKDPEVIAVFTQHNNNRVLVKADKVDKEVVFERLEPTTDRESCLYKTAYFDMITGHYNWNYLWPFLTGYEYMGIQDSFAYLSPFSMTAVVSLPVAPTLK